MSVGFQSLFKTSPVGFRDDPETRWPAGEGGGLLSVAENPADRTAPPHFRDREQEGKARLARDGRGCLRNGVLGAVDPESVVTSD
ncbi:hypothetical protein HispidOSU_018125 [Sigmodon hispidus]